MKKWIFKDYYIMNKLPMFIIFLILISVMILITVILVVREIQNEN